MEIKIKLLIDCENKTVRAIKDNNSYNAIAYIENKRTVIKMLP